MTDFRQVGNSGLTVSTVGLGCNNLGRVGSATQTQEGSNAVVHAALEAGITLFDVADMYGGFPGQSEAMLAKALGGERENVVVATKFGLDAEGANGVDWGRRGSRKYIMQAVEASLRRLDTDYIDLYYYHSPDGYTPLAETLAAMDELVTAGKVRYLGHSNLTGWQVADAAHKAASAGAAPFISAQNHWSLLERGVEAEVVPAARHFGLGVLPYYPLANGMLTGKVRRGQAPPAGTRIAARSALITDEKLDKVEALIDWGAERGVSLLEIAIGGLAAQPGCASVIAGATTAEQVAANAAAGNWVPTPEELEQIDKIVPPPAAPR